MDRLITEFDRALRTLVVGTRSQRPLPGAALPDCELSDDERRHVIGLMRVNHCGEICAQALYQGQALAAKDPEIRESLRHAGEEETEHLAWTESRLSELNGRTSYLNPLWYVGALSIGLVAARCGARWNLGFLAETERQVEAHLHGHLQRLPVQDQKTLKIIEQMKVDEARHAATAIRLGAAELPGIVKSAMKAAARVMTSTAYYL